VIEGLCAVEQILAVEGISPPVGTPCLHDDYSVARLPTDASQAMLNDEQAVDHQDDQRTTQGAWQIRGEVGRGGEE
jgi:hypothetical protein